MAPVEKNHEIILEDNKEENMVYFLIGIQIPCIWYYAKYNNIL